MKHGFKWFLAFLLFVSIAKGQNSFQLGIMGGPQLGWMVAPEQGLDRSGSYLGYYYGAQLDLFIADNYSFCTGVIISQTGGKLTFANPVRFKSYDSTFAAQTELFLRNEYLQVPVSLRLLSSPVGNVRYFGQFGLDLDLRIRSRGDITAASTQLKKINFAKDAALFNLGLLLGGGVELDFPGVASAEVGLQFSNGFTNVLTLPKDYKSKARQNSLRLLLAVNF